MKHDRRGGEQPRTRRPAREPDGERDQQDGRARKADAGTGAFCEVFRHERTVDPGADGAGEDDDVPPELGEPHLTITSPSMSRLCSVQT